MADIRINSFQSKSITNLIIGLFFLIWATNAYFIFGNNLKYISLVVGFLYIAWGGMKLHKSKSFYFFFGNSLSVYFLYFLLAIWNHQQTLEPQSIAFSIVCYFLLVIGFLYGSLNAVEFTIHNKYKLLFSLLVIVGSTAFYFNQSVYLASSSEGMRDLGDESLNPIGVAYSHSLLVIFLFWILQQTRNKFVQLIIIIAVLLAFIVVISTLSRGAILFLFTFFTIYFLRGLRFNRRILVTGIKTVACSAVFLVVFFLLLKENNFFQLKMDAVIDRFQSLLGYTTDNNTDLSAAAREDMYEYFFNNLPEFYLGELNYDHYPHNQFLEILMRWGFFGLPLLIFSIAVFIKGVKYFKRTFLKKNAVFFLIVSLFLFSYLQSMTSMSLEMNRMLWLGFGFIYSFSADVVQTR